MESYEKGRKMLIIIIGLLLSISIISIGQFIMKYGLIRIETQIVRTILSFTLYYFLYQGHRWARITTIILMSSGALLGLMGIAAIMIDFFGGLILIMITVVYAFCVIKLASSKEIKHYFEVRTEKRKAIG